MNTVGAGVFTEPQKIALAKAGLSPSDIAEAEGESRVQEAVEELRAWKDRWGDLSSNQATAIYAQSWALTYFLMTRHQPYLVRYLWAIKKAPPAHRMSASAKLKLFTDVFGPNLRQIEQLVYQDMQGK